MPAPALSLTLLTVAFIFTLAQCYGSKGKKKPTRPPKSPEVAAPSPPVPSDVKPDRTEEPIHLPASIQLDVLSFFKHTDVERYRLVSRQCNSTVENFRQRLPNRPVFESFSMRRIILYKRTDRDGFIDGRHTRDDKHERESWVKLIRDFRCCRSMTRWTDRLIGQRIYTGTPEHIVVWIEVVNEEGAHIVIGMRNELTERTAFQLIHFLRHLNGTVFAQVQLDIGEEGALAGIVNPNVFRFTTPGDRGDERALFILHHPVPEQQLQEMNEPKRQALQTIFALDQEP